jgi:hypothetical protein
MVGGLIGLGAATNEVEQSAHAAYVARYGEDNAAYLLEVMGAWRSHYGRAVFIDTGSAPTAGTEARVRDEARRRGWAFDRMAADMVLVRRLLEGDWADDFLVLEPGQRLAMSYDSSVVRAEPAARTRRA